VIAYNNCATNDPCALCGARTDPVVGPEAFIEGYRALVCRECSRREAPAIHRALVAAHRDLDDEIAHGAPAEDRDDRFWGCPECPPSRGPDAIYNAGKAHRAACHTHRTTWLLGSNLFSAWREESEQEQRDRWREIEDYRDLDAEDNGLAKRGELD